MTVFLAVAISVPLGAAPAVIAALWRLRNQPAGVFRHWAAPFIIVWLLSPLWAGLPLTLGVAMTGLASSPIGAMLGVAVFGCVPALIAGGISGWILRSNGAGICIGFATWLAPVAAFAGVGGFGAGWSIVIACIAWNAIAIICIATHPVRASARWFGHCGRCGTDLRSLEGDACPSCGRLRRRVEIKSPRSGACPRCGYDLRGIDAERCPECGAVRDNRAAEQAEAR